MSIFQISIDSFLLQVLIYLFKFESRISVRCPVRQCKKVFLDSRTFLQHVVKTHKDGIHFSKPSKTGNGSVVGFSEFLWKKCLSFWKSLLNPCYKIFWGAFVLVFRFFTSNFSFLTLSWRSPLSCRNQSIDLLCNAWIINARKYLKMAWIFTIMHQFVGHYISAKCVRQNLVTKHLIQPIFACLWTKRKKESVII